MVTRGGQATLFSEGQGDSGCTDQEPGLVGSPAVVAVLEAERQPGLAAACRLGAQQHSGAAVADGGSFGVPPGGAVGEGVDGPVPGLGQVGVGERSAGGGEGSPDAGGAP
jgi:hypothetical protein